MKNTMKKISIFILSVFLIIAVFSPVFLFAQSNTVFNADSKDYPLLQIANYTKCPGCDNWSRSILAEPGDIISLLIYYHNSGNSVAQDTRVKISVPQAKSKSQTIYATLWAQNAPQISGSVKVSINSPQSLSLISYSSSQTLCFYPKGNRGEGCQSLPFGQSGKEILSSGIRLGNIEQGWATQGYIVLRLKVSKIAPQSTPIPTVTKEVIKEVPVTKTITQTKTVTRYVNVPTPTPIPQTPKIASCSCSAWEDSVCGGGDCPNYQMLQTRKCSPSGCDIEKRCVNDPQCSKAVILVAEVDKTAVLPGSVLNLRVYYKNGTDASLNNALLSLYFPNGAIFQNIKPKPFVDKKFINTNLRETFKEEKEVESLNINLGTISPGQEGEFFVELRVDEEAEIGESLDFFAELQYNKSMAITANTKSEVMESAISRLGAGIGMIFKGLSGSWFFITLLFAVIFYLVYKLKKQQKLVSRAQRSSRPKSAGEFQVYSRAG